MAKAKAKAPQIPENGERGGWPAPAAPAAPAAATPTKKAAPKAAPQEG